MSFRELRNFTEIMRALGYPRLVSLENFRQPNFELVVDCLDWLVKRYDPKVDIADDIETEADRVTFIKAVAQTMAAKGRIKLNAKRLYAADGYAVKEMLKIAEVLYKGMLKADDESEEPAAPAEDLGAKSFDVKRTRQLASEITSRGAALYDMLESEAELREARRLAIGRNLDTQEVEAFVNEAIQSVAENSESVVRMLSNLEKDEKNLEAKIEKRKAELERSQKRLATLQNVRPAYMDEYEALQRELQDVYTVYLERFRNLQYLNSELDAYDKAAREQMEERERKLEKMQKRLRDQEMKILRGEAQVDEGDMSFDLGADDDDYDDDSEDDVVPAKKGAGRGAKTKISVEGMGGGAGDKEGVVGSLMGGGDEDDSDDEIYADGSDGSSTHVSLNDGDLTDDLIEDDDEDELSDVDEDDGSESDNEF